MQGEYRSVDALASAIARQMGLQNVHFSQREPDVNALASAIALRLDRLNNVETSRGGFASRAARQMVTDRGAQRFASALSVRLASAVAARLVDRDDFVKRLDQVLASAIMRRLTPLREEVPVVDQPTP